MTNAEVGELKRRIERLSAERIELFGGGGTTAELAKARTRLQSIERELDECYRTVREHRAVRDSARFSSEDRVSRSRLYERKPPG